MPETPTELERVLKARVAELEAALEGAIKYIESRIGVPGSAYDSDKMQGVANNLRVVLRTR